MREDSNNLFGSTVDRKVGGTKKRRNNYDYKSKNNKRNTKSPEETEAIIRGLISDVETLVTQSTDNTIEINMSIDDRKIKTGMIAITYDIAIKDNPDSLHSYITLAIYFNRYNDYFSISILGTADHKQNILFSTNDRYPMTKVSKFLPGVINTASRWVSDPHKGVFGDTDDIPVNTNTEDTSRDEAITVENSDDHTDGSAETSNED